MCECLTSGHEKAYQALSLMLRAHLNPDELQSVALSALDACDEDRARGIAVRVLGAIERAGWPAVPFGEVLDEATFWAEMASPAEWRAYALVCLGKLTPKQRAAVLVLLDQKAPA